MKLHNPNFTAFDGTPITGRIPPRLFVANDIQPTAHQLAGVAHAYKLFCDAKNVSLVKYFTQHRVLQDGTRIGMESINDKDVVVMWPVFAEGKTVSSLRGFIVTPMFVTGHTVLAQYDTDFLTLIDLDNKWMQYKKNYEIGAPHEAFPYTVSQTVWDGKPALIKLAKPNFKGYAGKKVRVNVYPASDDKYNDVFTLKGTTLYKNAVAVKKLAAPPPGVPCVFDMGSDTYVTAMVSESGVSVSNGSGGFTNKLDWYAYFLPVISGYTFGGGPELHVSGSSRKARYLGYNVVAATKAVQWWRSTVDLTATTPFGVSTPATGQLGVPGILADFTGYSVSGAGLSGPFVTSISGAAMQLGFLYSNVTGGYEGNLSGSGTTLTDAGGGNTISTFNKTYSLPESMPLNESETISIARSVTISATLQNNSINVQPLLPQPMIYDVSAFPGSGLAHWISSPGSPTLPAGSPYGLAYNESCEQLSESDSSFCTVTIPNLPAKIYDISVSHSVSGISGFGTNHNLGPPPPGMGVSIKPDGSPSYDYLIDKGYFSGTELDVASSIFSHTVTSGVTAAARDYIYSDRDNDVHLYIEALISGAITLNACLRFGGTTHTTLIYGGPVTGPLSAIQPWGINFGTDPMTWDYHAPPRPSPIYAPIWQTQGLCPYIAYTTVDETAVIKPRITAFFRLQLLRTLRSIGEADPPTLNNVVGFPIYMCEQLMNNYGVNAAAVINESVPVIVKFTSPDATLYANIGAPADDTAQYAKLSRT